MPLTLFDDHANSGAIFGWHDAVGAWQEGAIPPLPRPAHLYRLRLWRTFGDPARRVVWLLLNPSVASIAAPEENDHTIRKCIGFSRRWGFGRLDVGNLNAYCATDPEDVYDAVSKRIEVTGPSNDTHLLAMCSQAQRIVVAWGTHGTLLGRNAVVGRMLASLSPHAEVVALRITKGGHPEHPRSIGYAVNPVPWVYK